VLARERDVCVVTSDGRSLSAEHLALDRPLLFTSSSLGDAVAEAPRRRLFDATVCGRDASLFEAQRRFHDHQWPDRPEISVRMLRPDARTVSRSFVTVAAGRIDFIYEPFVRAARAAA
jgi:hypothetical protein